ncbi:MAG TPA: hypothetical protein VE914_12470 [Candidatus Angelobacter sp.]|nr:hypothetical protein [Candidatus Angelobacter sp.]
MNADERRWLLLLLSSPGLTRRSIPTSGESCGGTMDARVKPGHDNEKKRRRSSAFIGGLNMARR